MIANDRKAKILGYGVILGSLFTFTANRMNVIIIPFIFIEIHRTPGSIGIFGAMTGLGALLSPYTNKPVSLIHDKLLKLIVFGIIEVFAGALVILSAYQTEFFIFTLAIAGYLAGSTEVGISTSRQELISGLGDDRLTDTFMSVEEAASKIAILGGGSLAGLTISFLGIARATIVPTLLILIGPLVYLTLKLTYQSSITSGRQHSIKPASDNHRSHLLPLPEHPVTPLIFFIGLRFVSSFMWFSFSLGLALYGSQKGDGGNGAALISVATVLYGAGTIFGASTSVYLSGRVSPIKRIFWGWFGSSIMFILLCISIDHIAAVGLVSFLGGLLSPLGIAALNTSIGNIKARRQRSQHQMFLNWGLVLAISTGSAAGGVILNTVGVRISLLLSGISVFVPLCSYWLISTVNNKKSG